MCCVLENHCRGIVVLPNLKLHKGYNIVITTSHLHLILFAEFTWGLLFPLEVSADT